MTSTQDAEGRTQNVERRTQNVERRTQNAHRFCHPERHLSSRAQSRDPLPRPSPRHRPRTDPSTMVGMTNSMERRTQERRRHIAFVIPKGHLSSRAQSRDPLPRPSPRQRPSTDPSTMAGMTNSMERRTQNARTQKARRFCHPERHMSSRAPFVIPSAVEGSASSTLAATPQTERSN
jgi:hypothetical protein